MQFSNFCCSRDWFEKSGARFEAATSLNALILGLVNKEVGQRLTCERRETKRGRPDRRDRWTGHPGRPRAFSEAAVQEFVLELSTNKVMIVPVW